MYIQIIIIILCWTLGPFVKKKVMNTPSGKRGDEITSLDFLLISNLIGFLMIIAFNILNSKSKNNVLDTFKKFTLEHWKYSIINTLLTLISASLFLFVLQKGSVKKYFPLIQSSVIILSFLVGSYVAKERITLTKILAIILISGGIVLLNN